MIDRGLIELFGPLGIVRMLNYVTLRVSKLQSGLIYHYAFTIIIGVTFFILLFILPIYIKTGLLLVFVYTYVYLNIVKSFI
jgi:uncharacterized membrane protein